MGFFGSDKASEKIGVIGQIRAKSGHEDEMRKALTALVGPSQKEPGCISYHLFEDKYYTGSFTTIEEWESEEALDVHLRLHKAGLDKAKALLREELVISIVKLLA